MQSTDITVSMFFTSVYLADSCSTSVAEEGAFISLNSEIIAAPHSNFRFFVLALLLLVTLPLRGSLNLEKCSLIPEVSMVAKVS